MNFGCDLTDYVIDSKSDPYIGIYKNKKCYLMDIVLRRDLGELRFTYETEIAFFYHPEKGVKILECSVLGPGGWFNCYVGEIKNIIYNDCLLMNLNPIWEDFNESKRYFE